MLSTLRLAAVLVFIAFPLLEIALLIKAGETIGFWPTMALLVAAAALGVTVIRAQGLSMVGRMFAAMSEGKLPIEPMVDTYAVVTAGFLLIMPGFLSDAVGLVLLVPPLRRAGMRWAMPGLAAPSRTFKTGQPQTSARATVIEGTYERIGEDDSGPGKQP
jgi:UPF0716 protein FxsA